MEVRSVLVPRYVVVFALLCAVQLSPVLVSGQITQQHKNRAQISADQFDNIYAGSRDKRTLDILLQGLAEALGYELRPRKNTTNAQRPAVVPPTQATAPTPSGTPAPAPPIPTIPSEAEETTSGNTNTSDTDLLAVRGVLDYNQQLTITQGTSETPSNEEYNHNLNSDGNRSDEQPTNSDEDSEISNYYRNNAGNHFKNEYDRIRGFDYNPDNQQKQQNIPSDNGGDKQSYNNNNENAYDQPWNVQLYDQFKSLPEEKEQSQTKRDEEKVDGYYNYQIPPPSTPSWQNLYPFGNDDRGSHNNFALQSTSEGPAYDYSKPLSYSFNSPYVSTSSEGNGYQQQFTKPTGVDFESTNSGNELNIKQQPGGSQINYAPNPEVQTKDGGKMRNNFQNSFDGKLPIASTSKPKLAQILQEMEGTRHDSLWPPPFHYAFDSGSNAAAPNQPDLLKNDAVIGDKAQLSANYNPGQILLAYAAPESDKVGSSQNWSSQNSNPRQLENHLQLTEPNSSAREAISQGNVFNPSNQQLLNPQNLHTQQGQHLTNSQPNQHNLATVLVVPQGNVYIPSNQQIFTHQNLFPQYSQSSGHFLSNPQPTQPNPAAREAVPQGNSQYPSNKQISVPQNPSIESQTTTSRELGAYVGLFIPGTALGSGFNVAAENVLSASPSPVSNFFFGQNNLETRPNSGTTAGPSQQFDLQQLQHLQTANSNQHPRNDRNASPNPNDHQQAQQNLQNHQQPKPPPTDHYSIRITMPEIRGNLKNRQDPSSKDSKPTAENSKSSAVPPTDHYGIKLPPQDKKRQPPPRNDGGYHLQEEQKAHEDPDNFGHHHYHDEYYPARQHYDYRPNEKYRQESEEKNDPSDWKSYSYEPPESARQFYQPQASNSPGKTHEQATFSVSSPLSDDYTNLDYFFGDTKQSAPEQSFQRRSGEEVNPTPAETEQEKTVHIGLLTIPPPTPYREPLGLGDRWAEEEPKSTGKTMSKETISRVSKVHVTGKVHFYPDDSNSDGRVVLR